MPYLPDFPGAADLPLAVAKRLMLRAVEIVRQKSCDYVSILKDMHTADMLQVAAGDVDMTFKQLADEWHLRKFVWPTGVKRSTPLTDEEVAELDANDATPGHSRGTTIADQKRTEKARVDAYRVRKGLSPTEIVLMDDVRDDEEKQEQKKMVIVKQREREPLSMSDLVEVHGGQLIAQKGAVKIFKLQDLELGLDTEGEFVISDGDGPVAFGKGAEDLNAALTNDNE